MAFVKENIIALLCVTFAILSQCIISLLPYHWGYINNIPYTYGEMLYHFVMQGGYISLFPSLILYKTSNNINSKGIYLGLCIWGLFELIQQTIYIIGFDFSWMNRFVWSKSDIMQIIFILATVYLTFHGYKRWNDVPKPHTFSSNRIFIQLQKIFKVKRKI